MKNHSVVLYFVSVLLAITILTYSSVLCYGSVSTSEVLLDPDGYRYDVSTGAGTCISDGSSDAYDNAYYMRINGVNYNASSLTTSGRNIIGSTEIVGGLRVARKLYVPDSKDGPLGNFGRWYDSFYNPTGAPITISVEYFSNLGSDGSTQITGTDDGDNIIELADQWVTTDDESDGGGDTSLGHVVFLAGGDESIDYIELYGESYGADRLAWRYDNVVVNPGQTIAFITFAIQENNRSASADEARGIIASLQTGSLNSIALQGLSITEYMYLVNLNPIPPDDLQIDPWEDFISAGNEGGPFDPAGTTYTLSNSGTAAFDWTVTSDVPWMDVDIDTGTLQSGGDVQVNIYINANANVLPQGIHTGPVSFTNVNSGAVQKRYVRLMIGIRRVLAYTQYADMSTGSEYDNTIKAIDSTGTNFSITELIDYTQLSSMLPMHQILLIPEQENASLTQLFDIGTAWSDVLQEFVSGGGTVIQCDYGKRYGIITGSGLMNITTSSDFNRQSVAIVSPDNPIVQGVSDPYTASRYSSYYYTTDGTPIVERPGFGPVVVHKMIGRGHVVLIGHDYYQSNPSQDKIIGNAVLYLPFLTDDLWVSPTQGLDFGGNKGGPFTPLSRSYILTNVGPDPLEWSVSINEPWLSITPGSGVLEPHGSVGGGDSQVAMVWINESADTLVPANYNDVITFTNVTTGNSEIRVVRLQVIPIPPEIEVYDSIMPVDDLDMPFGEFIVDLPSAKEVMLMNMSPDNDLTVSGISIMQTLSKGFYDDFGTNILNSDNWTVTRGEAAIDDVGLGEPSMPYSLRLKGHLDGGDVIESRIIDLSGLSGLEVRYWWQRAGGAVTPQIGNDLLIEYFNGIQWIELERHYGDGPNMSNYTESIIPLPPGAYHENFRLRIGCIGMGDPDFPFGDWFIDNISIPLPAFRLNGVPGFPIVIAPLDNVKFDVIFTPTEVKEYEGVLVITSNDDDESNIDITLSGSGIPDYLEVFPKEDFDFSGHISGPFLPSNIAFKLTNNSADTIEWAVEPDASWLDIDIVGGSIAAGGEATVVVSPNTQANTLPAGKYIARLIFTDITTSAVHKRIVILNVQVKPKVWVKPQTINVTVSSGQVHTETLNIGNVGDGDLEYVLKSREISFVPISAGQPDGPLAKGISGLIADIPKRKTILQPDVPHAEGELLVRFAPNSQSAKPGAERADILIRILGGASIKQEYSIIPGLCLIKLPEETTVEEGIRLLGECKDVLYAEPNYKVHALSVIPDDPMFDQLWNMHNTTQTGGTNDADIDAPEAWGITSGGGSEIIVAVIDTGVDYRHPDLAENIWINRAEFTGTPGADDDSNGYVDDVYGYDFANRDGNPIDDNGHGSHVSGIIGAVANNNLGIAGICWNVKIMPIKFLDSGRNGYNSDAILSIEYATRMGARIISNSWGGNGYNSALEDAIKTAGDAGVLFVTSAGDNGRDNDIEMHYPSGYELDNIIAVMSTDYHDRLSGHSNYGLSSVDLGAPGGDSSNKIRSCDKNGGYTWKYGTSIAAAHVSGGCALVWSACPILSHTEVKDIIMRSADPLASMEGRCVSGGRLNLHNAILEAQASWIDIAPDTGTISPGEVLDVAVTFDGTVPIGSYTGQIIVYTNDPYIPQIITSVNMTVEPVDYCTEMFKFEYPFDPDDPRTNDMANRTLTLTPIDGGSAYRACSLEADAFSVDPSGGIPVVLRDDDSIQIDLSGEQINFYGKEYGTLYVGSNGYITFVSADAIHLESFVNHFDLPRISTLFDDLDPSAGGTISWKQLADKIVITFENVPEFSLSNSNSFQVEIFYNGRIKITYLDIAAHDGLVGISQGHQVPKYFIESNLSEYSISGDFDVDCDSDFADYALMASYWQTEGCTVDNEWCSGIDVNKDSRIDIYDFTEFAEHWLEGMAWGTNINFP